MIDTTRPHLVETPCGTYRKIHRQAASAALMGTLREGARELLLALEATFGWHCNEILMSDDIHPPRALWVPPIVGSPPNDWRATPAPHSQRTARAHRPEAPAP